MEERPRAARGVFPVEGALQRSAEAPLESGSEHRPAERRVRPAVALHAGLGHVGAQPDERGAAEAVGVREWSAMASTGPQVQERAELRGDEGPVQGAQVCVVLRGGRRPCLLEAERRRQRLARNPGDLQADAMPLVLDPRLASVGCADPSDQAEARRLLQRRGVLGQPVHFDVRRVLVRRRAYGEGLGVQAERTVEGTQCTLEGARIALKLDGRGCGDLKAHFGQQGRELEGLDIQWGQLGGIHGVLEERGNIGRVRVASEGGDEGPIPGDGWIELGYGLDEFFPFEGELPLTLGPQGFMMFSLPLHGGGFPIPPDPFDFDHPDTPILSVWTDIEGIEGDHPSGHFAAYLNYPVPFSLSSAEDVEYEFVSVWLVVPETYTPAELAGREAVVHAELSCSDGQLLVDEHVLTVLDATDGTGMSKGG